jgi:putative endonuclease
MKPHVYIMTNRSGSVLYTGVTSDIKGRMIKHKLKKYPHSFTARYNVNKLVYYEAFDSMMDAIKREKQIKAGSRIKKEALINAMNPEWSDLPV